MNLRVKPKSYGPVFVHIDSDGGLLFGSEAESVNQSAPPVESPADCLLYALGSCIAISLQMAAKAKKVTLEPFTVRLISHKAETLPSRFGRFEIEVEQGFVADAGLAESLLRQAKAICTVSNTLNAEINLGLSD